MGTTKRSQWVILARILKQHWNIYGGVKALLSSPYLWSAFIGGGVLAWSHNSHLWAEKTESIIPGILGFSVAGYAIVVGFSDGKFVEIISGDYKNKPSPFMKINSSFLHFIISQLSALFLAVIATFTEKSNVFPLKWIGITLLLYALLMVLATAISIFNFSNTYDQVKKELDKNRFKKELDKKSN